MIADLSVHVQDQFQTDVSIPSFLASKRRVKNSKDTKNDQSQHEYLMSKKEFHSFMTKWLRENFFYPYPDQDGIEEMARSSGRTTTTVLNWLNNNRSRKWYNTMETVYNMNRPSDYFYEDCLNVFDGKPVRVLPKPIIDDNNHHHNNNNNDNSKIEDYNEEMSVNVLSTNNNNNHNINIDRNSNGELNSDLFQMENSVVTNKEYMFSFDDIEILPNLSDDIDNYIEYIGTTTENDNFGLSPIFFDQERIEHYYDDYNEDDSITINTDSSSNDFRDDCNTTKNNNKNNNNKSIKKRCINNREINSMPFINDCYNKNFDKDFCSNNNNYNLLFESNDDIKPKRLKAMI